MSFSQSLHLITITNFPHLYDAQPEHYLQWGNSIPVGKKQDWVAAPCLSTSLTALIIASVKSQHFGHTVLWASHLPNNAHNQIADINFLESNRKQS